jgi:hypothetical protein
MATINLGNASPTEEVMAGKKTFSMERPTDKARDLAAKLTLEEQVRTFFVVCRKSLDHHERQSRGRIMQGVGHFTIVP